MNKKIVQLGIVALLSMFALSAFAGTTTNYSGTAIPASALDKVYVMENKLTLTTAAAGDVVKCIGVPTGTLVVAVGFEVLTSNNYNSATATIGDVSSTNRYMNAIALNATSKNVSAASSWLMSTGESIDILFNTAATGGVYKIRAVIADLTR